MAQSSGGSDLSECTEQKRLNDAREQAIPWKKWGPYLSERQWGTVREDYSADGNAWDYFTHDQSRSRAYHQGTAWPWLAGPFVEAWVRVRGGTAGAKREARRRFLAPLFAHLDEAGLGHVSEIADADPPHTPRGCPFQAWSLGELLRLDRVVLAEPAVSTPATRTPAASRPRHAGRGAASKVRT